MNKKDFKQIDITSGATIHTNLYREYEQNIVKDFMEDNKIDFSVLSDVEKCNIIEDKAYFYYNGI